ncbi:MAG: ABC transporter permease [Bacteroidota bacterium]
MIKNFFVITYRHLARSANYTLINALGLSIGISACIIIFLVVSFEWNYDRFHSKYENIYRLTSETSNASGVDYSATTPYPLPRAFHNDFPDLPLNTHVHFQSEAQFGWGAEKQKVENILFADSLFFKVFDYEVLTGNPYEDLAQPGQIFLTESLAKKLGNPVPSTILLNNKLEVAVAGLVADPPANSHLKFTAIVSYPSLSRDITGLPLDSWGLRMAGHSYVVIPDNFDKAALTERLAAFVDKYQPEEENKQVKYIFQPLSDIHFSKTYPTTINDSPTTDYNSLMMLMVLGVFILTVACINFINLSTALAVKKSKEIGVRKTLGANRSQLTTQYLTESFLITLLSTLIALGIVEVAITPINHFLDTRIAFQLVGNMPLLAFILALVGITTLLAGLYPALVLSRFNPAAVLKNKMQATGSSGSYARKYLVVFQFVVAQLLIIGTVVVASQMEYFRSKPLGFIKDAIINIQLPDRKPEQRTAFLAELSAIPGVEKVSYGSGAPTSDIAISTGFYLTEKGVSENYGTYIKCVDYQYQQTYGLELVAGRWFLPGEEAFAYDSLPAGEKKHNYVVNEALVRKLGFATNEEIIGVYITTGMDDISAPVIGVVKDFHISSLHDQVEPVALMHFPYFFVEAGIRFNSQTTRETLAAVEKAYAKIFPDYLFEYTFLDDHIGSLYSREEKTFGLIRMFTALAIAISCLGLLGLVSFITQQKLKEVGIRKVFGANVYQIVLLFSRGFVKLVMAASVLAVPVGWYVMNDWLNGFAYRTPLNVSVFVIAVVSTLVIALLTVSFQSIRAATSNPVHSLRSE